MKRQSIGSAALLIFLASGFVRAQDTPVDDAAIMKALNEALKEATGKDGNKTLDVLLQGGDDSAIEINLAAPSREKAGSTALYQRLKKSVFLVGVAGDCNKCKRTHPRTASAFAIGKDVIVTNFHVVEKGGGVALAMDAQGKAYPFKRIVMVDAEQDLAVVQVSGGAFTPLPLATKLPEVGSDVFILSHPSQNFWVYTKGIVSRIGKKKKGNGVKINVTAPYAKGSSGAPVVDSFGNVVSVIKSTISLYTTPRHHGRKQSGSFQMMMRQTIPGMRVREILQN